jgi:hypothetical protein
VEALETAWMGYAATMRDDLHFMPEVETIIRHLHRFVGGI